MHGWTHDRAVGTEGDVSPVKERDENGIGFDGSNP